MEPNYYKAARKATETMSKFGTSAPADILQIIKQMPNVAIIALDIQSIPGQKCWDAFTCVRKNGGILQYIVVYNKTLSSVKMNLSLARELAHIIMKHDLDSPESIWSEEANCFAYHCICYQPYTKRKKTIHFRPKMESILWEMKNIQSFESIDQMKSHVADEQNRFAIAIQNSSLQYSQDNVELHGLRKFDHCTGWKNCYDVVLNGKTVGYCGE